MKIRDQIWLQVSRELVRALRGRRSQKAFCRRLGYRGKPVADWESGRRFPTAATTLTACRLMGVEVHTALSRFFPGVEVAPELAATAIAEWMQALRGGTSIAELAKRSGLPRFSISRFLSGQSQPRLPQFLALVDAMTGRASDLVAELVDIEAVPALREQHRRRSIGRRLAYEQPWTAAVLRVLETEAYGALCKHIEGWIGSYLGIDFETETTCLDQLEQAGMISLHDGKYHSKPTTVDTQRTADENRRIKKHWAEAAGAKLDVAGDSDLFSYNVVSVSRVDLDRIREILRSSFREIRSLVSASEPPEEVALVQLQLVHWQAPAAAPGLLE